MKKHTSMNDTDHSQIDLTINGLPEQLSACLENISRSIHESPRARAQ